MCFLSRHCRKVHNCLPQVNCFCGKQLGTWKRLLIHKQLHFPENVDYECKECKLIYKLKTSYENHLKTKHGPDAKKFVCSHCARCFKDSRTLVAHEKTHLPDYLKLTHPCEICNKKFVNKNSLKSHVTSVHEMANLYTCETCGKGKIIVHKINKVTINNFSRFLHEVKSEVASLCPLKQERCAM